MITYLKPKPLPDNATTSATFLMLFALVGLCNIETFSFATEAVSYTFSQLHVLLRQPQSCFAASLLLNEATMRQRD